MVRKLTAALMALLILGLTGCGGLDMFYEVDNKPAGSGEAVESVPQPAYQPDVNDVWEGVDRIFYDNTQTVFSYLSSREYMSAVHAVMQAEALREAECYVMKIRNGRQDERGNTVGFLHWQPIEYNALRTCFADRSLYTYAQNGEIPKLADKGPLGLLFEDEVLDAGNLNIIITDLVENNFGASQIAAGLSGILAGRDGTEAALYGFKCDGFSGNMSFPGYTSNGTIVRTVENYRGMAAMYILAVGPSGEVEAFGERLRQQTPEEIELHKAVYVNGDIYPGYTGMGQLEAVGSLDRRISGGSADTLNYTVNAQRGDGLTFEYDGGNTSSSHRDTVQISLIYPLAEDSPFIEGGISAGEATVTPLDKKAKKNMEGMAAEISLEVVKRELKAWKEGAERSEPLNDIYDGPALHITVTIPDMQKGRYKLEFSLTAPVGGRDWIEGFSASVFEYQSLSTLLDEAETPNHLVWKAGATDILSRTLDLADVDRLLADSVSQIKTVDTISLEIHR